MPMIWKSEKLACGIAAEDMFALCVLILEKAGVDYSERDDYGPCVLETRTNLRVAACRTHDEKQQDRILSLPPILVRVEQEEIDSM